MTTVVGGYQMWIMSICGRGFTDAVIMCTLARHWLYSFHGFHNPQCPFSCFSCSPPCTRQRADTSIQVCKNSWIDQDAIWNTELGGSSECVLRGDVDAVMRRALLRVSVQLKNIEKHRIWEVGLKDELCKNSWTDLNDLWAYVVWHVFLCKKLHFGSLWLHLH